MAVWEYKVIAGTYSVDGGDVVVENPLGRGTLQRILDHYGAEGYELSSTHYDNINRELVMLLKRPKGGAALQPVPLAMGHPAAVPAGRAHPAAAAAADEDDLPPRRQAAADGRRRRSKAELDRLARE